MKILMVNLLLLMSTYVFSKTETEEECDPSSPVNSEMRSVISVANRICPNSSKLIEICNSVGLWVKDKDPNSNYVYEYQRKIYEASCVDLEKDSEKEISRKVAALWDRHEKDIKCNSSQFDVQNGSLLKLAVSKAFTDVLEDAVYIWKINLNRIDESDKHTVLDYVRKELEKNKNTPSESTLKMYYNMLKEHGAEHHHYKDYYKD